MTSTNPASERDSDTPASDESASTSATDRQGGKRPISRVFAGPSSHWVQYAGPDIRPAATTDAGQGDRSQPQSNGDQDPHRSDGSGELPSEESPTTKAESDATDSDE